MNGRTYVVPRAIIEQFCANDYISACGDQNRVYKFECNAGVEFGHYYGDNTHGWPGMIYKETNGISGLQRGNGGDQQLGSFYACNKTHDARTNDEFEYGYYVPYNYNWAGGGLNTDYTKNVRIWRGDGDLHATEKLNMNEWLTDKS